MSGSWQLRPQWFQAAKVTAGLPNCSLNCRTFCGGPGPPRTIEIFSQEDQKDRRPSKGENLGFALPPAVCCCVARRRGGEQFKPFHPSDLPVKSRSLATAEEAARGMRTVKRRDATVASAGDLPLGSQQMWLFR